MGNFPNYHHWGLLSVYREHFWIKLRLLSQEIAERSMKCRDNHWKQADNRHSSVYTSLNLPCLQFPVAIQPSYAYLTPNGDVALTAKLDKRRYMATCLGVYSRHQSVRP